MKLTVFLEDPERKYEIPLSTFLSYLNVEYTEAEILNIIQSILVAK
jgi:hypothetical protein